MNDVDPSNVIARRIGSIQQATYELSGLCVAAQALAEEIMNTTDNTFEFGKRLPTRTMALRNSLNYIVRAVDEVASRLDWMEVLADPELTEEPTDA